MRKNSDLKRLAGAIGLLLWMCLAARAQSADWGEPVNGVQVRLAVSVDAKKRPATDNMPHLELQIRNLGKDEVTFNYLTLSGLVDFEIDGLWYGPLGVAGNFASQGRVGSGAQSENIRLPFCNTVDQCNGLYPIDSNGRQSFALASRLILKPGAYLIRARTASSAIETSIVKTLQLVSNAIVIDVPEGPSLAQLIAQASAGGPGVDAAVHMAVERYPEAALDAIKAGIHAAQNEFQCVGLVSLASRLKGDSVTDFLRSKLGSDAGVPSQVAAAKILFERGQPEAIPAMIDAWRKIQPRLPANQIEGPHSDCNNVLPGEPRFSGNEATAYSEVGMLITFLASSGDANAIEALGRDIHHAPVDVRLAAVRVFLPRGNGGGSSSGRGVDRLDPDIPKLPDGAAGAAIERLLVAALDDTARRYDMKGAWKDVTFADPRIRDMAALVLSTRWPDKYQFRWSADVAECDKQIDVIRSKWTKENGVVSGSPRVFAVDTPPEKWAATAALDAVQAILRDSGFVGPGAHTALWNNLSNLERAAQAVSDDDGTDRGAAGMKKAALSSAFRNAMNNAVTIGNRANETADATDKSKQLAAKLRAIYEQYLP